MVGCTFDFRGYCRRDKVWLENLLTKTMHGMMVLHLVLFSLLSSLFCLFLFFLSREFGKPQRDSIPFSIFLMEHGNSLLREMTDFVFCFMMSNLS